MTKRRNKKKSAFTLMELLLVMAILIILGSLVTVSIIQMQGNALENQARIDMKTFEKACELYYLDVKTFPNSLQDLRTQPQAIADPNSWRGPYLRENVTPDPWGSPYQISIGQDPQTGQDMVIITSNGKDRQQGTGDDLSNVRQNPTG